MIVPLVCHPDTPAHFVTSVEVEVTAADVGARLSFLVKPAAAVKLPDLAAPARVDGLWQHTCFELFVQLGAGAYLEFNLSPSSQWAAYTFGDYRVGMRDHPVAVDPHIEAKIDADVLQISADIDLAGTPSGPLTVALSAVIEEIDGAKSYWALRHPPGNPDFHHSDCFALQLP